MSTPVPRLLVSAAHKSSGKTTVSMGLCAALRARGLQVQPFKKGPDYIDPMRLAQAAGKACHNLDFYVSSPAEIVQEFAHRAAGADVALVEANKGLYDGMDLEGRNSNAALAKLLGLPVVLVLDTAGTIRGVAPLLLGYQQFDPGVRFAGVILNRVGGARHEAKLRAVIEHYTDIPVLGAVHRDERLRLDERHLGLIPSNEWVQAGLHVARVGERVAAQVDLEALLAAARAAPPLHFPETTPRRPVSSGAPVRVGVVMDQAFGFYYPGDLERLEAQGAQIVRIDALHDQRLPEIDALFIGGGFPETQMTQLAANAALRGAIREAAESGLPVYAECGGLMYLSRSLRWRDRSAEMVGLIPAVAVMHDQPQGRGYVRLRETGAHPWHDAATGKAEIAAHEFHYSALEQLPAGTTFAYRMLRGRGIAGGMDGIVYRNVLACYAHLRDTAQYPWTQRFLDFVRRVRSADVNTEISQPSAR